MLRITQTIRIKCYLLNLLILYTTFASAEIVFDGSLGPAVSLNGPDFEVTANFGKLHGSNLFHSFKTFDLTAAQTANFSGPNTVQNIIGRVTAGEKSSIDGVLRSSIPQADLYLLNPDGFIFGKHARLDLQGSLFVSTASQLKLGSFGVFTTRLPERSVLVSASPSAFGFLDVKPATIEINSSNLVAKEGETLSVLGGEIKINRGLLRAISGRVNLAAITKANELTITPTGLNVAANAQFGKIDLENNAMVDVGRQGTGDIYIRGGQFFLENSFVIAANTEVNERINVIRIDVKELRLDNQADIDSRTYGPGQGGQIIINVAGETRLSNNSTIRTNSLGTEAGKAGNISLKAQRLSLFTNSSITSNAFSLGDGGNITIKIHDNINLNSSAAISADSADLGNAGNIYVSSTNLAMDAGTISTAADKAEGGNIVINARNQLIMYNSVFSANVAGGQGNGGNLAISNPGLFQLTDSQITANASGGNGGFVLIVTDILSELGESWISASSESGREGDVKIDDIYNIDINTLPVEFLDVSNLIKKRCNGISETQSSSFFLKGRGGLPNAPDDLQTYMPIGVW